MLLRLRRNAEASAAAGHREQSSGSYAENEDAGSHRRSRGTTAYIEKSDPAIVAAVDLGKVRTQLSVPLLKEDEFIGAITLWRDEIRPFEAKQIELVQNFAAQAVIAIENARLLNELHQRTGDLTEALEQQITTADILGVISKSLSDTQPVFDAIVQSGARTFFGGGCQYRACGRRHGQGGCRCRTRSSSR